MFRRVRLCVGGLLVAAALAAGGAAVQAATITSGALLSSGIKLDLDGITPCGAHGLSTNVGAFVASGPGGSGKASCGNKRSAQVKTPTTPHPYGRYDPNGVAWIDSNDLTYIVWNVSVGKALTGVSFALTDARDQANSFFRITVDGAIWEIAAREANGALNLITILFDAPVMAASILFETAHNDGYGVADATVQPVPLPAGLPLTLAAIGLIAAARSRRRAPLA